MRPGPRRLPQPPPSSGVPSMNLSRAFDRARRDSDATSVSSLPSSIGTRNSVSCTILSDRASQLSALSYLNSYLAELNASFSLSPPFPSGRDIAAAFIFLLERLDYPISEKGLEDDLPFFLQILNCPFKLNKSALKAPGAPHTWPKILAALYWLAQFARVSDHLSESEPPSSTSNDLLPYLTQSYSLFLSGDDNAVEELDEEYASTVRAKRYVSAEQVEGMEKDVVDLEAKLAAAMSGPSLREEMEKKRGLLIEDKKKFEAVVESWTQRLCEMEETRNGLKKELEAKNKEHKRLSEEKAELEKRIGMQGVSVRDVERMKREIQVLDRDIEEAKNVKSVADEKVWETEAAIAQTLDEMEVVVEQCNLAVKKLKLEIDFKYMLNVKGSTPAEVIGADYRTILKPTLKKLTEEIKNLSVSKEEESIALQEQLQDKCKVPEEKKKLLTALQDRLDEIEGRLRLVKNEVENHRATCAAETKKMTEYMAEKENQLSSVENEAQEFLKSAETKLRDAIRMAEEETQLCAHEVIAVMDAAIQFKESMESMTDATKAELAEYIDSVAALSRNLNSAVPKSGLKRARSPPAE